VIQKPTRRIHGPEKAGIKTGFTVLDGSHSAEKQDTKGRVLMWRMETASDKKERPSATTRFDLIEAEHYKGGPQLRLQKQY